MSSRSDGALGSYCRSHGRGHVEIFVRRGNDPMTTAVSNIWAARFFHERNDRGFCVGLQTGTQTIGLDAIEKECGGENRLGNQEKGHENVCLSHMTSGIQ